MISFSYIKLLRIQPPYQATEVENIVTLPETTRKLDWKKPDLDREE